MIARAADCAIAGSRIVGVLTLTILVTANPAAAAPSLCAVVERLETAPVLKTDNPRERRWIEFHWGFDRSADSLWSWGCRHSGQAIAKETCSWLQSHTNQEFTMQLPQDIMSCYGYRFPRHAAYDWSGLAGTVKLHGRHGDTLLLDLSYRDLPRGEQAIRLAVEADDADYEPDVMPPITPWPESESDARGASPRA